MSICACAGRDDLISVPFSLRRAGARSVHLAFFLNRAPDEPRPPGGYALADYQAGREAATASDLLPMARSAGGLWRTDVPLRPGWYAYSFLVDGEWVLDAGAPDVCSDGIGGRNSVRVITAPAIRFPRPPAARVRSRGAAVLRRAV